MLIKDRYQVLQTLGEGGFGTAYLAKDMQIPSKRQCVIKQLKPITNSPEVYALVQERFQREAAVLEQLGENHPLIPRLYAYFTEAQKFYLVQEWIEGTTLDALAQQQLPQPEAKVRSILTVLLSVLDFIHSQGIIHRDIKPENIILRRDTQQPVLIDFGAVRETMGTVLAGQTPTSSIVIGTPGYMSSEQATGRPVPASDLYSLALTAVYLLTGQNPQAIQAHPQTGELLWQQEAGTVSDELVAVLTRAVQYHPRDRYNSAKEMLTALSASASGANSGSSHAASSNFTPVINVPTPQLETGTEATTRAIIPDSSFAPVVERGAVRTLATKPLTIGLIALTLALGALGSTWAMNRVSLDKGTPEAAVENVDSNKTIEGQPESNSVSRQGSSSADVEVREDSESIDSSADVEVKEDSESIDSFADEDATKSTVDDDTPMPTVNSSFDDTTKCFELVVFDANDTQVNVRDLPGGTVVGSLSNRAIVRQDGAALIEPGWNEVFAVEDSLRGYVWGELLFQAIYQVQDPNDTFANLRTEPNGEVVTAVSNGSDVQFLGVEGDWTQVQTVNGLVGYIFSALLQPPSCF